MRLGNKNNNQQPEDEGEQKKSVVLAFSSKITS